MLRKTKRIMSKNRPVSLKLFSVKTFLLIFSIIILVLGVFLLSEDTSINFTDAFKLPEFNSLTDMPIFEDGQWAIAIDGSIARTSFGAPCEADVSESPEQAKEARPCEVLPAVPTASTAKMILALAVMQQKPFELGEAGETITISQDFYNRYAWYISNNGSTSAVVVGEEISEYDALASVLMVSSNNLADNLAVWAFGSLENYKNYATEMLKNWEITNTTIGPDASGYDPATTSNASDLAKIATKLLENPVLAKIVGTKTYTVPVAGTLTNTNQLLGSLGVIGVKTGWIGDASGYNLISAFKLDETPASTPSDSSSLVTSTPQASHLVTLALLGAPTRSASFSNSRSLISKLQSALVEQKLVAENQVIGYLETWWTDRIPVYAKSEISAVTWQDMHELTEISVDPRDRNDEKVGSLKLALGANSYETALTADDFPTSPTLWQRFLHLFGWQHEKSEITPVEPVENSVEKPVENSESVSDETSEATEKTQELPREETSTGKKDLAPAQSATSGGNCTASLGILELINPNFPVSVSYIDSRRSSLISVSGTYGIPEYHRAGNGDNLMNPEAASHLNDMVNAYKEYNPGHEMGTYSCYRARGTTCGRLCAATGTSDHHTGLTCDLIDQAYGTVLDTDTLPDHLEWQWLKANSYKYGFIDRFPEAWAGGSMSEPLNVDANGSTGLFETWHYRYVGITAATEIATGKYNNGNYDSLEHYLLARSLVKSLKPAACN